MPKALDAATKAELQKDRIYMTYLVEIHFDQNPEYFTTAHIDLDYQGHTFVASSKLLNVTAPKESQRLEAANIDITFSGVDKTILAKALQQYVVNRKVVIHRALLDTTTYAIIGTPVYLYAGRIKSFSFSETPKDTATLKFSTSSVLADFERTSGRRTNARDQESYLDIRYGGSGTALSGTATTLTDDGTDGPEPFKLTRVFSTGQVVNNVTDGSTATLVSVDSVTTITTTTLTGGTSNTWAAGDSYQIVPPVDKGFELTPNPHNDIKWGRA